MSVSPDHQGRRKRCACDNVPNPRPLVAVAGLVIGLVLGGHSPGFAQARSDADDPSFREFPSDQVLAPRQLKALLARVQMEQAKAEVAKMLPEELLEAVRKEVLSDLPDETRRQIADIAQDVVASNGPPRNAEETQRIIQQVRQRLQSEMPDAWQELAKADEKNRETFQKLQEMVPEIRDNTTGSNRRSGRGGTATLNADGTDSSVDSLLSDLLDEVGQRGGGLGGGGLGGGGLGDPLSGGRGSGSRGNGSGLTGRSEQSRRVIQQLMNDRRQSSLAGQGERTGSGGSDSTSTSPRDDSNSSNSVSSLEEAARQRAASEPLSLRKDASQMSMAQRFNKMVQEVTERTRDSDAMRKTEKRKRSDLGGFEPFFDRFSKSVQASINDSFAKSAGRANGGRGRNRSGNDNGFFRRSRATPPPPPATRPQDYRGTMTTLLVILVALVGFLFFRNRQTIIDGADRYLGRAIAKGKARAARQRQAGIVQAIDALVLDLFDRDAAFWNHAQIRAALCGVRPESAGEIGALMTAYKSVRYAPEQATLSSTQMVQAESLLDRLERSLSQPDEATGPDGRKQ